MRFLLLLITLISTPLHAQQQADEIQLRFHQKEGDVFHADALVREQISINGLASHEAGISESSVSQVLSVDSEGSAVLDSIFRTEERIEGLPGYVEWSSEERVTLSRSRYGELTVPENAVRPVLRNLPVFPDTRLTPGDTWTFRGREVHYFRINSVIYGPYTGDFPVMYEYRGIRRDMGKTRALIAITYSMHIPVNNPGEPVRLVSGTSSQELLWDLETGYADSKNEEFHFFLYMSNGSSQEIHGEQKVVYRKTQRIDRASVPEKLKSELKSIPYASVETARKGVKIILGDDQKILFRPESSKINPEQEERLALLAEVLSEFRDRDVLISGHTADYGSAEGRRRLSLERAAAVADKLFPGGRQGTGRLFLRGLGASELTGSDAQDRRVEIFILD